MTQKNKVQVRIAGKDYALVGTETDEYIQKIALYIDKKMNEIMKHNNKLSTSMAAVLTAVNIADDFFRSSSNEDKLKAQLETISNELKELRLNNKRLTEENTSLSQKSTSLQLELAKREAELREVRNSVDKLTGPKR